MARGRELLSPGTRQYATKTRYSTDTLHDIKIEKIAQWETARLYYIPRQTLVNKLKNKHSNNFERPDIFSLMEVKIFMEHCVLLCEMVLPILMFDLWCIVKEYLDAQKRVVKCFQGTMPVLEWEKTLESDKSMLQDKFPKNISKKELK